MMSSLMCSDGLLQQHFLLSAVAAVKCQITAGAKFLVIVPWLYNVATVNLHLPKKNFPN